MTKKDVHKTELNSSEIRTGEKIGHAQTVRPNGRAEKADRTKNAVYETKGAGCSAKSGRFSEGIRHVSARDRAGLIKLADR